MYVSGSQSFVDMLTVANQIQFINLWIYLEESTIWHKIFGETLTNLTNFYKFVSIFSIKIFHFIATDDLSAGHHSI